MTTSTLFCLLNSWNSVDMWCQGSTPVDKIRHYHFACTYDPTLCILTTHTPYQVFKVEYLTREGWSGGTLKS